MKTLAKAFAALALFALAACDQPLQPGAGKGDAQSTQPDEPDAVILGSTRNMPDWLFILRTNDGGTIHFNQRALTRADGMADIWLQVHYGHTQLWQGETETRETVIHYDVERLHYRFNCTDEKFVIVERQIMGSGETVVARDEPTQVWRLTPETGAARHVLPIACHGA